MPATSLLGRRRECAALDRLVDDVRAGRGGALVLQGAAGAGKTALLRYAAARAAGCRLACAAGAQPELELPHAALHQLCAPLLDGLDRLPEPQRDALAMALGLRAGRVANGFLIPLAVLGLLTEAAAEAPLLCVIDDLQWFDRTSAQALGFAARRLGTERIGLVMATTGPGPTGLPALTVRGLRRADALALLRSAVVGPLDEGVAERIVDETEGNPLALLELPDAGGFGPAAAPTLAHRIEDGYGRRLAALPTPARRLLLTAAAEPTGDPLLLWGAAARLGVAVDAAEPAFAAGLLELGARVRFRHPLMRSAVYRAAAPGERRAVHRALAEVTDAGVDPDRRAWHLAHAAAGPDEAVAAELERSAGRAQARGGFAAAGAFLERAAALSPGPAQESRRALAAAQALHRAGAPDAALRLLAVAQRGPLGELDRAQADVLRAQVAFATDRGGAAPPLLLEAARRLEPLDAGLARECYLDAFAAAMFAGRCGGGVAEIAAQARAAPRAARPRAGDLLLDGLAVLATEGHAAAAPLLTRAVGAFVAGCVTRAEELRWLWLACLIARDLWDDGAWDRLSAREYELARESGELTLLPIVLSSRIGVHVYAGELPAATAVREELGVVSAATECRLAPYGAFVLAAWRGDADEALDQLAVARSDVLSRGEGSGLTAIHWATALLHNSLGQYGAALAAAELAVAPAGEGLFATWALSELIEAAARHGTPERGADTLRRLGESTLATATAWGLGVHETALALLAEEAAEAHYRRAIGYLRRTRMRATLARTLLLYGEWLRRRQRSRDAREPLREARAVFSAMGARAFARRAENELRATGEVVGPRGIETRDRLTARESQIAGLARDGLSNPLIGSRLFISPRTVEYHLHKVFRKLDIASRAQLADVLPCEAPG